MFTGIIEEIGKVERIQKDTYNCKLSIKSSEILEDIHLGDSIAVNGICLTVTCFTRQSFISLLYTSDAADDGRNV